MSTRHDVIARFERWSPTAFVVGGLGLLGTSVVGSLDIAGVVQSTPRLAMGPLLFGLLFVFIGLVGLYPRVAEGAPKLSLAGVSTSTIAFVVWTATMLAAIGVDVTSERTFASPGSWGPPLLAGAFVLALLSFLLYGIGSTLGRRPSRRLGVLLLVPLVAFFGQATLLVSKILTGEVVAVLQLALGAVTAVALITAGYLLRRGTDGKPDMEERSTPSA